MVWPTRIGEIKIAWQFVSGEININSFRKIPSRGITTVRYWDIDTPRHYLAIGSVRSDFPIRREIYKGSLATYRGIVRFDGDEVKQGGKDHQYGSEHSKHNCRKCGPFTFFAMKVINYSFKHIYTLDYFFGSSNFLLIIATEKVAGAREKRKGKLKLVHSEKQRKNVHFAVS